jgi:hypothetical protein
MIEDLNGDLKSLSTLCTRLKSNSVQVYLRRQIYSVDTNELQTREEEILGTTEDKHIIEEEKT